jgi:hypothetical protein
VLEPPPDKIIRLFRRADSRLEHHLTTVTKSASLALEMVNGAIAEHDQLRREWEVLQRRFEIVSSSLMTRRAVIEAFIRDLTPLSHESVVDPVMQLENIEDREHQE